MGFWDSFKSIFIVPAPEQTPEPEKRMLEGAAVDDLIFQRLFTVPNNAGQTVNADTVLGLSTVWRAVNIIADSVASLPCNVVRMRQDGQKDIDQRHPIYRQLAFSPAPMYTAYNFFGTLVTHALLYGNAYAEIRRQRVTGYPRDYIILSPDHVTLRRRANGSMYYDVQDGAGNAWEVNPRNMIHVNGLSWNGVNGLQVIRLLADNFGLALANQEYLTKFFSDGATIAGVLKHPGRINGEALARLRQSWERSYSGSKNAAKVAILEEGMDYAAIGLSPQQAGAADTKKLTVSDIARIFGVPQFLLEDLDRATFNNIEHLSLLFMKHTIRPWCKRIEAELNIKLFPEDEQMVYRVEFDISDLEMSDLESRSKWVESMMKWGILNRDEVRRKEGYNDIEDGTGKAYYVPMNMTDPAEITPGEQNTDQNADRNENIPR